MLFIVVRTRDRKKDVGTSLGKKKKKIHFHDFYFLVLKCRETQDRSDPPWDIWKVLEGSVQYVCGFCVRACVKLE